jgi:hypothetical protein
MGSSGWTATLLRGVGLAAMLHAIGGLAIGLLSVASFAAVDADSLDFDGSDPCDSQQVRDAIREGMPKEECQTAMGPFDAGEMRNVMGSATFRWAYASFVAFGILVNGCLLHAGRLLWKARPGGVTWLVVPMIVLVASWYGVGRLWTHAEWGQPIAAATGIGNMGIVLLHVTWFWLWGPALCLVAAVVGRRAAART